MQFNLLDEPWIPCLGNNGKLRRIGLREALTQAGTIRQIAASNPMDRLAILRFLLALLYWCKGNPPADTDVPSDGLFPSSWFAKLDQHRDCFNLLGGTRRFYQYRKDGDKPLTANYLLHEIPTGTNFWHFRHSTDGVDGLCLACCAMGLIRLPVFSTSGGRGKPPGINRKPPIYVVPIGETLAATLRLCWRQTPKLGMPAWEKPDIPLPKTCEVPLLTGLTWLPRRVWLGDPEIFDAVCIGCGRQEPLVRRSVFGPIGSSKTGDGGVGPKWQDPHVVCRRASAKDDSTSPPLHAANSLKSADASAGQWAGILAGILRSKLESGHPSRIWVVGFSTVQNDKYLEATEFMVPVATSLDNNSLAELADQWGREGSRLARKVSTPYEKKRSRKHVEVVSALATVRPHIEGKVAAKAGELLGCGDAAWQQAADEYRPMMEVVARSLSPGFTTAAVQRRRRIASTLPI